MTTLDIAKLGLFSGAYWGVFAFAVAALFTPNARVLLASGLIGVCLGVARGIDAATKRIGK